MVESRVSASCLTFTWAGIRWLVWGEAISELASESTSSLLTIGMAETIPGLGSWRAQSTRVTGFLAKPTEKSVEDVYSAVMGAAPETVTKSKILASAETGTETHLTKIELRPDRVDVNIWTAIHLDAVTSGSMPSLGGASDYIDQICSIGAKVVSVLGDMDRYAIGAVCHVPGASREEPYRQLREILGINYLNAADCSEFQFRLNRPILEEFEGTILKLNRLGLWGATALNLTSQGANAKMIGVSYALQVTLDFSTPVEVLLTQSPAKTPAAAILGRLAFHAKDLLIHGPSK